MVKPGNFLIKNAVIVVAMLALVACGSSSNVMEPIDDGQFNVGNAGNGNNGISRSNSSGGAITSPGSGPASISPEQIQQDNALRQTIFYFDFDLAEFKTEDRNTLTFHARDLAANPNKRIRLEGHSDERGTREYNLALGERRANSILNYLVVNGASRAQIEVVSYGEERPARTGETDAAYALNRRVEIVSR